MKHLAFTIAALAACTGEGKQIVIQLDGPVQATTVELVFADPHVVLKRNQRINNPPLDTATEPAFYVLQRTRLELVLGEGPQPVDDVEVQVVGADRLLPIAIAKDVQGQIVGMGILDPPSVFFDDNNNTDNFATNLEERADVTRYAILVEPVTTVVDLTATGSPVHILGGQVHHILCLENDTPLKSGLVWRPSRADELAPQLRIALPNDGGDDALSRVETTGFDLDCDTHTPSERGSIPKGDEADCDDTSAKVLGEIDREVCDKLDNDCDPNTMGATVIKDSCGSCLGNRLTCYDGANGNTIEGCPEAAKCFACNLHTEGEPNVSSIGCKNVGTLDAPLGCSDQCVMRVVTDDPNWEIKIGEPDDPSTHVGRFHGFTPTQGKFGFSAAPKPNASGFLPSAPVLGGFMIAYQPSPTSGVAVTEIKFLSNPATTHAAGGCPSVSSVECGPDT